MLIDFFVFLFSLLFDLISKQLVFTKVFVDGRTQANFIPNFISLEKRYNLGAGFSTFENNIFMLKILPIFMCLAFIFYYFYTKIRNKNFKLFKTNLLNLSLMFLLSGALGNLYDRFFVKEGVRDFLKYNFIETILRRDFAVGNVADVFILLGVLLIVIYLIKLIIIEIKNSKKQDSKKDDNQIAK